MSDTNLTERRGRARQAFMEGRIVEAGWITSGIPENGSGAHALEAMQGAFYLGVQYFMRLMINPPPNKTEAELEAAFTRMVDQVNAELKAFMASKAVKPKNIH